MSVLPIAFQLYSCAIKKSKECSHLIVILSAPALNYVHNILKYNLIEMLADSSYDTYPGRQAFSPHGLQTNINIANLICSFIL
jgi:hypothetical protein